MPAITFKVFAAIAGVLTGLGGFILASQAMTLALVDWLGPVVGLCAAAAILVSLAALSFWFVQRTSLAAKEEAHDAKSAAADMISDLPGQAVLALIRKHPLAVSAAAVTIGYTLMRDPRKALRQAQAVLLKLIQV
jgi:hypothetical protein